MDCFFDEEDNIISGQEEVTTNCLEQLSLSSLKEETGVCENLEFPALPPLNEKEVK